MATAASKGIKEFLFEWEGKDRNGKIVRGETRAGGENQIQAMLRRQGVTPSKIKKRRTRGGKKIKPKDIALFTRQLATIDEKGVPLCAPISLHHMALLWSSRSFVATPTPMSPSF